MQSGLQSYCKSDLDVINKYIYKNVLDDLSHHEKCNQRVARLCWKCREM